MASDDETTVGNDAAGVRGTRSTKSQSTKKKSLKKKGSSGTRSTRSKKVAAQAGSDDELQEEMDEKLADDEQGSPTVVTEITEAVVEETIVYQNNEATSFVEENGIVLNDPDGNCIVEEVCTEATDDVIAAEEVVISTGNTVVNEEGANESDGTKTPAPESADVLQEQLPAQTSSEMKTESVTNDKCEPVKDTEKETDTKDSNGKDIISQDNSQENPQSQAESKKTSEVGTVKTVTVKEENEELSKAAEVVSKTSSDKRFKETTLEAAKSVEEEANSVEEEANSVEEEANSVEEEANSVDEDAKSVDEDAKSVDEEAKSVKEEARSVKEEARSVKEEVKSVKEEVKCVKEEAKRVRNKEEAKSVKDKEEGKSVKDKEEGKSGKDREEAKRGKDREEAKRGKDREEAKRGEDREEPKSVEDREEPKSVKDREEPKSVKDREEPKSVKDKEEVKCVKDKEEVKSAKEDSKRVKGKEVVKSAKDKEVVKSAKDKEVVKSAKDKEVVKSAKGKEEAKSAKGKEEAKSAKEEKESVTEDKFNTEPETEMVSEDELPNESSKEPLETEAVSDEELPEPVVTTDLPETEAVSEDEFPPEKTEREGERERERDRKRKADSNKDTESSGGGDAESSKKKKRSSESQKRKLVEGDTYDPSSPTSENSCDETPAAKRAALSSGSSSVPKSATKARKVLPELEKYWKAVKEDPSDFTGWTYLLQYVDQENDIDAAREAYDAFLSHYPYCYGYWRKYADYEKRKGNKRKCEEVFERGLKAIPLSVDLWIHFLNYSKATYPDDEAHLRCQFEKAINACGMEFRSDRLWESFIKWENEGKRLQNVTALYDRLLTIPTQGYTNHFDNFQEHISSNPPQKVLSVDEFLTLRREVLQLLKQYDQPLPTDDTVPGEDNEVPPGEEPEEQPVSKSDEETTALREKIISIRKKIHKSTVAAVAERWNYEEGIKRPYFHVKPLERCQLKNWKEYLDFEIEQGDQTRIIVLFERCLIACALYEEFWIKFIRYLESLKEDMTDKIRNVYERACTIHHTKKPNLHLHWAVFEESQENYDKAAEILTNLEKLVPNMLQVAYRRINLERRRNDLDKVAELYEHYINTSKSKVVANNMAIKYARFSWKILGDIDRAISILNKAVEKDKENPRLYLQLIDMGLQKNPLDEAEIIAIIDQFLSGDADPEQKVLFAQRKVEFLEDFGKDVIGVQKAHDEFQRYFKMAKDRKKKSADAEGKSDSASKKAKSQVVDSAASQQATQAVAGAAATTTATTVAPAAAGQYAQSSYAQSGGYSQTTATGAAASSSYQSGQYPATQPPTPYSQPPYNQQYSQSTDPNYANYQNWGYSQTGYGGYNQGWGNYNYY